MATNEHEAPVAGTRRATRIRTAGLLALAVAAAGVATIVTINAVAQPAPVVPAPVSPAPVSPAAVVVPTDIPGVGPIHETGWIGGCTGQRQTLDCSLANRVSVVANGQIISVATIRLPADTRRPVMLIQVPLGIYIPADVTLAIDNSATTQVLEVQTCDGAGCYAGFEVPAEFIAAMQLGGVFSIQFQALDRSAIAIPISLTGFTAAYAAVQ